MASCKAIEARTRRDYQRLRKAWDQYHLAKKRLGQLRVFGRHSSERAYAKARSAIDAADGAVREASVRVERSMSAMNACMRKSNPLSGPRRRRRR